MLIRLSFLSVIAPVIAMSFFAVGAPARASLGGDAASVASDQVAIGASRTALVEHRGYSVHELSSPWGTVREYVAASGVVFGIGWNGIRHPALPTLLGAYAPDYSDALSRAPVRHERGHKLVNGSHVVVETWGHMRSLHGHAYDPGLIPNGVSSDEIQ